VKRASLTVLTEDTEDRYRMSGLRSFGATTQQAEVGGRKTEDRGRVSGFGFQVSGIGVGRSLSDGVRAL